MDGLDDAAGQSADIGPAVAPYLGLIPDAPERKPVELSPQSPGDGLADGGLAGPGRPDEAKDGSLYLTNLLLDGQVFKDPLFDLSQAEMVIFQDLSRFLHVDLAFRGL